MKFRSDFVTNSSSSSFILARKVSKKRKKAIAEYVEKYLLGKKVLTPENTEEEIQKFLDDNYLEDKADDVRKFLKDGFTVSTGIVDYEDNDPYSFLRDLWLYLEKDDPENFVAYDVDLSY